MWLEKWKEGWDEEKEGRDQERFGEPPGAQGITVLQEQTHPGGPIVRDVLTPSTFAPHQEHPNSAKILSCKTASIKRDPL